MGTRLPDNAGPETNTEPDVVITPEKREAAHREDAKNILFAAVEAVSESRGPQHGFMQENFEYTAQLWTAYLGYKVSAQDVAAMNMLQKLSRSRIGNGQNADHYTDMAGYSAIMGALRK